MQRELLIAVLARTVESFISRSSTLRRKLSIGEVVTWTSKISVLQYQVHISAISMNVFLDLLVAIEAIILPATEVWIPVADILRVLDGQKILGN